jgi:hypothetical protein
LFQTSSAIDSRPRTNTVAGIQYHRAHVASVLVRLSFPPSPDLDERRAEAGAAEPAFETAAGDDDGKEGARNALIVRLSGVSRDAWSGAAPEGHPAIDAPHRACTGGG